MGIDRSGDWSDKSFSIRNTPTGDFVVVRPQDANEHFQRRAFEIERKQNEVPSRSNTNETGKDQE